MMSTAAQEAKCRRKKIKTETRATIRKNKVGEEITRNNTPIYA